MSVTIPRQSFVDLLSPSWARQAVADAYTNGSELTIPNAAALAWKLWIHEQWTAAIDNGHRFTYTYKDVILSEAMKALKNGDPLPVSTVGNSPYPKLMDSKTNLQFRAIHDLAHYVTGADDTWRGECLVAQYHISTAPKILWPIIASEVIGQAAVATLTGNYPEQKVSASVWPTIKGIILQ